MVNILAIRADPDPGREFVLNAQVLPGGQRSYAHPLDSTFGEDAQKGVRTQPKDEVMGSSDVSKT